MKNPENMNNDELYMAWFDITHRMILRGLLKPEESGLRQVPQEEMNEFLKQFEMKENENA